MLRKYINIIILTIMLTTIASNITAANYYAIGKRNYVYRKYDKAKEMFLKAVEHRDNGNAYYFLGEMEKANKNYNEASNYYLKAVESKYITKTYLKNSYWNLILFAEQGSDYAKVAMICKKMWVRSRDKGSRKKIEDIINKFLWTNNKEAISKYNQGKKLLKRKKVDEAKIFFLEALELEPNFLAPQLELGLIKYKDKQYEDAEKYLSPIVSAIPFYGEINIALGEIALQKKNYSQVITYFSNAIKYGFNGRNTSYKLHLKRAIAFYKNDKLTESLEDLAKATKLKRKQIKPLLMKASIEVKLKKFEDAIATLKKAKKIKPNSPAIIAKIGKIYYKLDDWRYNRYFEKILSMIKKGSIKKIPKYRRILEILIENNMDAKNYTRTIHIIKLFTNWKQNYDLVIYAAQCYHNLKRYGDAIDLYNTLDLNTQGKILLAKSLWGNGDKEKSITLINQNIQQGYNEEK